MSMTSEPGKTATVLLQKIRGGDLAAEEDLFSLLYSQLKAVAKNQIRDDPAGQSLGATGLVHEAYLRLCQGSLPADRRQFFSYATTIMKNILVDHARKKKADKRGGERRREQLDIALDQELKKFERDNRVEILALHEALDRLKESHPRPHEVVMLRIFAGHTVAEVANLLGIGTTTVDKDWKVARANLLLLMKDQEQRGDSLSNCR